MLQVKVIRGLTKAHLTVDIALSMSYQVSTEDAIRNAGRLMKEGGAQSVKIEGFHPEIIKKMVSIGIPVVAHLGLTPQSVHALGGFKVQGREEQAQQVMIEQAIELANAGALCWSRNGASPVGSKDNKEYRYSDHRYRCRTTLRWASFGL